MSTIWVMSGVFGSMHAFSVLLTPLEDRLGVGRGRVSLIYAVALVMLTVAVRWYGDRPTRFRLSPGLAGLACLVAALGLVIAGSTGSYQLAVVGYGLVFGGANGVGYAAALEWSARSAGRPGPAMAVTTAAYAVGAALASVLLRTFVDRSGLTVGLVALAGSFVVVGIAVGVVFRHKPWSNPAEAEGAIPPTGEQPIVVLWFVYGLGVFAGLMALGHGAEILKQSSASATMNQIGVVLLTLANAVGGLGAAVAISRVSVLRLVVALPGLAALALVALSLWSVASVGLVALAVIGLTYGAIIAVYPVLVLAMVGPDHYPATYGRVFTAWGVAGLCGPLTAGFLFDRTGSYRLALLTAAGLAVASAVLAASLRPGRR